MSNNYKSSSFSSWRCVSKYLIWPFLLLSSRLFLICLSLSYCDLGNNRHGIPAHGIPVSTPEGLLLDAYVRHHHAVGPYCSWSAVFPGPVAVQHAITHLLVYFIFFAQACLYVLNFIGLNLGCSLKFPVSLSSYPSSGISTILSVPKRLRWVSGETTQNGSFWRTISFWPKPVFKKSLSELFSSRNVPFYDDFM